MRLKLAKMLALELVQNGGSCIHILVSKQRSKDTGNNSKPSSAFILFLGIYLITIR